MIEYYSGILIMTTNRIKCIDPAFHSRIHLAIEYEPLTPETRAQIWVNFVQKVDQERPVKEALLKKIDKMKHWKLNGRQIRNIMRLSQSLISSEPDVDARIYYEKIDRMAHETLHFEAFFREHKEQSLLQLPRENPDWC